jgi:hypothetical protein
MKAKGKSQKEKVGARRGAPCRVRSIFTFAFLLFPFAFASAHEPITTKVRFNKEVIRSLQRSCLGCHHPGGIAMSLATYDEARPWAKAIKEEVLEKRMPPWHAVKGYGEFRNTPSLTQRDVDLIVNWVEGGAPKGDDKDLPTGPLFLTGWQLGPPDLVLKPEGEAKVAADADEYRTFVLPTNLSEARWLTAVDLRPGNAAVVHCAKFYLVKSGPTAEAPMTPAPDEPAAADMRQRLAGFCWMPGQKPVELDGGVAQLLPAGSRIAVTIHYHGSGEVTKDQTVVGLYFGKVTPTKLLQWMGLPGSDEVIPVGAEPRELKKSITVGNDVELIGLRPRVHPLMISFQATAYRPDGSQEVLIWARGYQFDWEPTYLFKQPVTLPKGTRVEMIAYFDNSQDNQNNPNNPPKPLRWSELTTDPWCVFLLASAVQ